MERNRQRVFSQFCVFTVKQVIEMLKIYRRRSKNNEKMVLKKSVVFLWKPWDNSYFQSSWE